MNGTVTWIIGALVALLGLAGLFLASRAVDGAIYWTGLVFFAFSVFFCFYLVDRNIGED